MLQVSAMPHASSMTRMNVVSIGVQARAHMRGRCLTKRESHLDFWSRFGTLHLQGSVAQRNDVGRCHHSFELRSRSVRMRVTRASDAT